MIKADVIKIRKAIVDGRWDDERLQQHFDALVTQGYKIGYQHGVRDLLIKAKEEGQPDVNQELSNGDHDVGVGVQPEGTVD